MKVIAYYLPQFHPIPENDDWWGKGFTEWTNVGKAKPLFREHYQPRVPADLGYYDLRMSEVREAQAEMANYAGIDGFCYWHYWFAGKQLLERPFNEVLESGKPDFPFCLAWANESWTGIWNNDHKRILLEQTYPGIDDYKAHFYSNEIAFKDKRYLKIDGRLIFVIYKPFNLPNPLEFIEVWNNLACENGLKGFYFIAVSNNASVETEPILKMGFDAINSNRMLDAQISISKAVRLLNGLSRKYFSGKLALTKYNYEDVINNWIKNDDYKENVIPSILPNWDTSPRSGKKAVILHNSTPELFDKHLSKMIEVVKIKQNKILFLKSWNEWAEGNYVEPDIKYGKQYIEVLRKHLIH
jgi:hypothetical protein